MYGRRTYLDFPHISRTENHPPDDPTPTPRSSEGAGEPDRRLEEGVLMRDPNPCYYVYRLTMGGHCQTGWLRRPR